MKLVLAAWIIPSQVLIGVGCVEPLLGPKVCIGQRERRIISQFAGRIIPNEFDGKFAELRSPGHFWVVMDLPV